MSVRDVLRLHTRGGAELRCEGPDVLTDAKRQVRAEVHGRLRHLMP
jgi:hypothetical protein